MGVCGKTPSANEHNRGSVPADLVVAAPKRLFFRYATFFNQVATLAFAASAVFTVAGAYGAAILGANPKTSAWLVVDAGSHAADRVAWRAVSPAGNECPRYSRPHWGNRLQFRLALSHRADLFLISPGLP